MDRKEFTKRLKWVSEIANKRAFKVGDKVEIHRDGLKMTFVIKWDDDFQSYALEDVNDDMCMWDDGETVEELMQNLFISYMRGKCDKFVLL